MIAVDPDRFLRELPDRFDAFPESEAPRDPRFAEILATVKGLATPNTLALLNHAVSILPGRDVPRRQSDRRAHRQ
jgi:hypothetical protein